MLRKKIVYASNGTLSDDDRALRWLRIFRGFVDQLLNLANTTDDGTGATFFAGYKTETAPFSEADGLCLAEQKVLNNRSMLRVRW